jgi:lysophospholipase L1-like esterase
MLGPPSLIVGINPNGQYPQLSLAPPGVTAAELNNIYVMLSTDTVHPSGVGAEYLAQRLAQNIYDAVMAL